jgi:DNA replication protein DnaC
MKCMAIKNVNLEEALAIERGQRKKYGATLYEILLVESKKFDMSIEEFLDSPKSSKRLEELSKVFEVMNQKEYLEFNTVLSGAPGLGKHKS